MAIPTARGNPWATGNRRDGFCFLALRKREDLGVSRRALKLWSLLLSILSSILPQLLERFGETMENMATAFYSTTTGSANCTIMSDTPNHIQGHASCFQSTNGLPFAPVGLGFGLG